MVSSSHVVSDTPSSSGGGLLTLFPCSSVRSLSWETVLYKILQCESFPWAADLHELPQRGPSHKVTSPASKPALAWAPLSMGPQVLAGDCSSVVSPWGHSLLQEFTCSGVESLPWAAGGSLLHHGPPWTAGGQPASPWSSAQAAREDSLLWHLEYLLLPSSSLTLVSAELFLSCHLTPLSQLPSHSSFFLPLLNYVITEVLPVLLIALALASGGSVLEPASNGFIKHWGSFLQLLTEATPIASLPSKPCYTNP